MSLSRGAVVRPAAAPTSGDAILRRCPVVLHATRPKAPSGSNRTQRNGRDDAESSSARSRNKAGSPAAFQPQDSKPAKASRGPKKAAAPPADDAGENGSGLEGLDELLADEAAVQQLRSSLLASLAAQHEEAMRAQQQETAAATTTAAKSGGTASANDRSTSSATAASTRASSVASAAAAADDDGGGSSAAPLVVLKKDKARLFVSGNPMVYGGAVDCVIGRPPPGIGEPVLVSDASRRPLGWGVFNPHSMFRVRLLQLQSEVEADPRVALDVPAILRLRVRQAVELRRALGLPSAETNVYRLINSEGDRLSGLVADVLGDTVVVQAVAGWVQRFRPDVESAIRAATGLSRIVWRPMWKILLEEGLQPPPGQEGGTAEGAAAEGTAASPRDGEAGTGPASANEGEAAGAAAAVAKGGDDDEEEETVEVREARLRLLASPKGQKTGFYADQRDSRTFLAGLVRAAAGAGSPPALLDLCCYSGGFALAAAAAGAARVVGVDSSEPAVKLATANAQLNGLSSTASFLRADVSDYMKAAVARGEQYDIVVLDPPKLAPDRNTLSRARVKYLRLNSLAMKLVRPGGLLMTCSCSGAMTQSGEFLDMVMEAAQQVGRQPSLLRRAGAATDHVLNPAYPEGEYLTNVTLRLL
ncbi:hypothetical protein PLESTF_001731500 [Pleodorina starrii]|nr:hypothetical protein PLESTM_000428300 [Pleodorina starrii]GLC76072.1 hypothetical protein PLESTF_001731500 [Pleodorina starrii]